MQRTLARLLRAKAPEELEKLQEDFERSISGFVPKQPRPAAQLSAETLAGRARLGDVYLSKLHEEAIQSVLVNSPYRRKVIFDFFQKGIRDTVNAKKRETGSATGKIIYDDMASLAYLAGRVPAGYAAELKVLNILKQKEGDSLSRVIDYGSGSGSVAWAFSSLFGAVQKKPTEELPVLNEPDMATLTLEEQLERLYREQPSAPQDPGVTPRQYIGLDASKSMVKISNVMFESLPVEFHAAPAEANSNNVAFRAAPFKLDAKSYRMSLPASEESLGKLNLSAKSYDSHVTAAVTSFTLSEISAQGKRKDILQAMWQSGAQYIVVIDRGDEVGRSIVAYARKYLLTQGKNELERERKGELDIIDIGRHEARVKGATIVAPCTHDLDCPMEEKSCYYSQRVHAPEFNRAARCTKRSEGDAKFSYIIIKRGVRERKETYNRIVMPPKKQQRHVIMQMCTNEGALEDHFVTKSQGRDEYLSARKSLWGDAFPYNGRVTLPRGGHAKERQTGAENEGEDTLVTEYKGESPEPNRQSEDSLPPWESLAEKQRLLKSTPQKVLDKSIRDAFEIPNLHTIKEDF